MQIVTIYTWYYTILGLAHHRIYPLHQLSTTQIESCKSGASCHAHYRLTVTSQALYIAPFIFRCKSDS